MTFAELGAIGEFVGSLAVLATLVYLAIQTRIGVKASMQKSSSDLLTRRQAIVVQFMDEQFIQTFASLNVGDSIDATSAQKYTSLYVVWFSHVHDVWKQHKAGLVAEDFWKAELALITPSFAQPGFVAWWEKGKQFFDPAFVEMMENAPRKYPVLFNSDTGDWEISESGLFGHDANVKSEGT